MFSITFLFDVLPVSFTIFLANSERRNLSRPFFDVDFMVFNAYRPIFFSLDVGWGFTTDSTDPASDPATDPASDPTTDSASDSAPPS